MSTIYDLPDGVEISVEGYQEETDEQGSSGTLRLILPGAAKNATKQVISGLPETFTYPGGITVTRIVPLKHPELDNCYADSFRIYPPPGLAAYAPLGNSGPPSIGFTDYFADVHFSTPKYGSDGEYPLVTRSLDGSADVITRPGSAYHFPSDGLVLNQDVGVLIPVVDFSLTFHRLPVLNEALYISLAGRVNISTFYGCAPGTVHYVGPSSQGQLMSGNQVSFDVTHRFRFRWIEHCRIMRPDGAGFEAPEDANGDQLLPSVDLNQLYQ